MPFAAAVRNASAAPDVLARGNSDYGCRAPAMRGSGSVISIDGRVNYFLWHGSPMWTPSHILVIVCVRCTQMAAFNLVSGILQRYRDTSTFQDADRDMSI
jgi:hypothetical protein